MRVKLVLLFLVVWNPGTIKSYIITPHGICSGPCRKQKCTAIHDKSVIHCYNFDETSSPQHSCKTICKFENMYIHQQDSYWIWRSLDYIGFKTSCKTLDNVNVSCSIHDAYEIWNFNYYVIAMEGLLFPARNNHYSEQRFFAWVARPDKLNGAVDYGYLGSIQNAGTYPGTFSGCQLKCKTTGNCDTTWGCLSFLPNYFNFGPVPPSDLNFDLEDVHSVLTHLKDNPPPFLPSKFHRPRDNYRHKDTPAGHCSNGIFFVTYENGYIDTLSWAKCNGEWAKWVVFAVDTITIESRLLPIISGNTRIFIACRKIRIIGDARMEFAGSSYLSSLSLPEEAYLRNHKWMSSVLNPDLAKPGNGGKLIVLASEWSFENGSQLTIVSKGGSGACGSQPRFTLNQQRSIYFGSTLFFSIKFVRPLTEMSFYFLRYTKETYEQNHGIKFKVYNPLKLVEHEGGKPACKPASLYGLTDDQRKYIKTYKIHGNHSACKNPSYYLDPLFEVMYLPHHGWYVRETEELKQYFYTKDKYDYMEALTMNDDKDFRDFDVVSEWAFKNIVGWPHNEQFKFLENLREIHSDFCVFSKKYFYFYLRYLIVNSKNLEDKDELKMLKNMREQLEAHFNSSDTFLKWIYVTAAAQERRLNAESSFIFRLFDYVVEKDTLLTKLYSAEERTNRLETVLAEYEDTLDRKIKAAEDLLKYDVMPTMKEIHNAFNSNFKKIKDEIQEQIRQAGEKKAVIKENIRKATVTKVTSMICDAIGVFGSVLSLFGPVAGAVGGAIGAAAGAVSSIVAAHNKPDVPPNYRMPESIKTALNPVVSWIERKKILLQSQMVAILDSVTDVEGLEDFTVFLKTCLTELRQEKPKHEQYFTTKKVEQLFKAELEKIRKELGLTGLANRKTAEEGDDKASKMEAAFDLGTQGVEVAGKIWTGVLEYKEHKDDIEKLEAEISQVDEDIRELNEFNTKLHDTIIPMAIDIMQSFDYITMEMNDTHLASIDVANWNIGTNIGDIKHEFKKIFKDFPSGVDMNRALEKLEKFLEIITEIFKEIARVRDQKVMAAFNANLALATFDPVHETFIENMDKQMTNAIIQSEVTTLINAFRKWSFPFVSIFMQTLPELQLETGNDDPKTLIKRARETVEKVRGILANYETTIHPTVDKFRHQGLFYRNPKTGLQPFYTWNHKEFGKEIYSLLSGNVEYFISDIKQFRKAGRHYAKEAIKFNAIGVNFFVCDEKLKTKLDGLLSACRIYMTHSGYSYYNYGGKIYMFTGHEITFVRSYDHSTSNFGSMRIENADAVLSPYGIWKIGLQTHDGRDFQELINLLKKNPKIDMELIGEGSFLDIVLGETYQDARVDKYLKPIDEFPAPTARDLELDYSEMDEMDT